MHSLLKRQLSSFMLYCNIHIFPAQWLWYADMGKDRLEKKDISAFSSRLFALRQHYSVIRLLLSRPSCYFWICPFPGFWYQMAAKIQHASVSSPIKRGWMPLLIIKAKYFWNVGHLPKTNYAHFTGYDLVFGPVFSPKSKQNVVTG